MTTTAPLRMFAVGDAIAFHLRTVDRPGWDTDRATEYDDQITLVGPRGERLALNRAGSHRSGAAGRRMTITGQLPADLLEHTATADANPTIGVDHTRPADAIARDIARRVLPGYHAARQAARARQIEEYAHTRIRDERAARLAAHLGGDARAWDADSRRRVVVRTGSRHRNQPEARFELTADPNRDVEVALTLPAAHAELLAQFLAPLLRQAPAPGRCGTCGARWLGLRDTDCDPLCGVCGAAVTL